MRLIYTTIDRSGRTDHASRDRIHLNIPTGNVSEFLMSTSVISIYLATD